MARIFSRNYQAAKDAIAAVPGRMDSEAPSTSAAANIGTAEIHVVYEPLRDVSRWTVAHRARPWAVRVGRTGYGTAVSWHSSLPLALAAIDKRWPA